MTPFFRLLRKEFALLFLDNRFLTVFGLCALLSVVSVTLGARTYQTNLRETASVTESSRRLFQESMERVGFYDLYRTGYWWSRRPEKLSPLVHGQSGTQPRDAQIRYGRPAQYATSHFETDPVNAFYGVLDLSFIVTVVLSLCALLFTHDVVCGEKEAGTLALVASFPISRAAVASGKILGAALAVMLPFLLAVLLSVASLSAFSDIAIDMDDWLRVVGITLVFGLHLSAFVASGVLVSALVARRITAFIVLLGLWTCWVFLIPNLANRMGRGFVEVEGHFEMTRRATSLEQEISNGLDEERREHWASVTDWRALSEARRQELNDGNAIIEKRWAGELRTRLGSMVSGHSNRLRARNEVAGLLALLSPVGSATVLTEDLARTGPASLARAERALAAYYIVLDGYVIEKRRTWIDELDLSDFPWFQGIQQEAASAVIVRNVPAILSLILLSALLFSAAFVAILKYDVR